MIIVLVHKFNFSIDQHQDLKLLTSQLTDPTQKKQDLTIRTLQNQRSNKYEESMQQRKFYFFIKYFFNRTPEETSRTERSTFY